MRKMLSMAVIGGVASLLLVGGTAFAASSPGAFTAQPEGTLTIQSVSSGTNAGEYEAIWNWSGLEPNQSVMLLGVKGTKASLSGSPETFVLGTASTNGGTATIYFPASDYHASPSSPETFTAYALFSSPPTGQLPEVPYAAAIPAAGIVAGMALLYRRRHAG